MFHMELFLCVCVLLAIRNIDILLRNHVRTCKDIFRMAEPMWTYFSPFFFFLIYNNVFQTHANAIEWPQSSTSTEQKIITKYLIKIQADKFGCVSSGDPATQQVLWQVEIVLLARNMSLFGNSSDLDCAHKHLHWLLF